MLALLCGFTFSVAVYLGSFFRPHEYYIMSDQGGAVVQNSGPDPFEVSDSTTMLNYLQSRK
jgi:hypothetical protein